MSTQFMHVLVFGLLDAMSVYISFSYEIANGLHYIYIMKSIKVFVMYKRYNIIKELKNSFFYPPIMKVHMYVHI